MIGTHQHLVATAHSYLDALAARDATHLPLAPNCRFTENCTDTVIGAGLWRTVTSIGFRRYLPMT